MYFILCYTTKDQDTIYKSEWVSLFGVHKNVDSRSRLGWYWVRGEGFSKLTKSVKRRKLTSMKPLLQV